MFCSLRWRAARRSLSGEEARRHTVTSRGDRLIRFSDQATEDYLRRLRRVDGWLDPFSAELIRATARFQHERGIRGGVGEIGVYHGKLLLLLYLSTRDDEAALAIDIFEQQHLNPDGSGAGASKNEFLRHARRIAPDLPGLVILEESSLALTPERIVAEAGRMRLFSIDGAHTEDATLNDLRLAESVASDEGVVIVDDYFNQLWPEVSVATAEYLCTGKPRLTPYAISPNKIFFCRPPMRQAYADMIATRFGARVEKRSRFFGHDVLVIGVRPWTWKRRLARTPVGNRIRRYVMSHPRLLHWI